MRRRRLTASTRIRKTNATSPPLNANALLRKRRKLINIISTALTAIPITRTLCGNATRSRPAPSDSSANITSSSRSC